MRKIIQYEGNRFGFLTVLRFKEKRPPNAYYYVCQCDCGRTVDVIASNLRGGTTQSCGCGIKVGKHVKHLMCKTSLYRIWAAMKTRCYDKGFASYKHYGGRGIRICNFIYESPLNLIELIGDRPKGYSIDRIDNDGHYSCGSCSQCLRHKWKFNIRWATYHQQAQNRRNNHPLTIGSNTMLPKDWARLFGITPSAIYHRISRGDTGFDLVRAMRKQKPRQSGAPLPP